MVNISLVYDSEMSAMFPFFSLLTITVCLCSINKCHFKSQYGVCSSFFLHGIMGNANIDVIIFYYTPTKKEPLKLFIYKRLRESAGTLSTPLIWWLDKLYDWRNSCHLSNLWFCFTLVKKTSGLWSVYTSIGKF